MALPAFREDGWFPEGHYRATWQEIAMRFGGEPDSRRALIFSSLLEWRDAVRAKGMEPGSHRRAQKECRVLNGTAHATLVYDGARCVGWCQFGSPTELPRIKHQRAYRENLLHLPDWRITCFFVDKEYRKQGVAATALAGALQEIGRLSGGTVESYPQELSDGSVSSSFLHNGPLSMFEKQGFERVRRLGKNHWVVSKVAAARDASEQVASEIEIIVDTA